MDEDKEVKSDADASWLFFARYAPARSMQRGPVRTAHTAARFGEKYGLPSFIMH